MLALWNALTEKDEPVPELTAEECHQLAAAARRWPQGTSSVCWFPPGTPWGGLSGLDLPDGFNATDDKQPAEIHPPARLAQIVSCGCPAITLAARRGISAGRAIQIIAAELGYDQMRSGEYCSDLSNNPFAIAERLEDLALQRSVQTP